MTREDFEDSTDAVNEWTKYMSSPIHHVMLKLRNHDAEQRAEIERLKAERDQQGRYAVEMFDALKQAQAQLATAKEEIADLKSLVMDLGGS